MCTKKMLGEIKQSTRIYYNSIIIYYNIIKTYEINIKKESLLININGREKVEKK